MIWMLVIGTTLPVATVAVGLLLYGTTPKQRLLTQRDRWMEDRLRDHLNGGL